MRRPTLIQGIGIAVLLTGLAIAAGFFFNAVFGGYFAAKATLAVTFTAYLTYLIGRGRTRAGRITLTFLCLLLLGWGLLAGTTLASMAAGGAALIWLVRSLTFYSSLIAAGADAFLGVLALGAGAWAFSVSGSTVAGAWCFFLVQALHAFIPSRFGPRDLKQAQDVSGDRFSRAHGAAEAAIEALIRGSK